MEKEKKAFVAGFHVGYRSAVKTLLSNTHDMPNLLLKEDIRTNINNAAIDWIKEQEKNIDKDKKP